MWQRGTARCGRGELGDVAEATPPVAPPSLPPPVSPPQQVQYRDVPFAVTED